MWKRGESKTKKKVDPISQEMSKRKPVTKEVSSSSQMDMEDQRMDIRSIMKDIEFLGSSHMTWKEKKDLENRKVVALGGKPPKKHRLPLSVARVTMKKQKEREEKMQQESLILGRFGGRVGSGGKREAEKRKPEDRVLKSTVGRFRNGVLDVKHLIKSSGSRDNSDGNTSSHRESKGKFKGSNNRGKKGGGKKRH